MLGKMILNGDGKIGIRQVRHGRSRVL
jgi:hypothetical protein